ncbi:Por secretion system C-terminal sorting domain-containing protein [Filimonas lacunae]|uniref:Por secretion system C-terminal sorting domain-containing protein n=1 Tax=Filimonas lacunae TaxID=477680 RepID=A0A173M959_9BACT|nr:endonuclease/exonuclease/phosphatase family protein [Filimonas lacunae]BAV04075.1 bacillopeptidase F precursor [Filimonas lacunae]SIT15721.1 Por secretion system C-terminal sorting domain-containing protein [Filimonas lacunae]
MATKLFSFRKLSLLFLFVIGVITAGYSQQLTVGTFNLRGDFVTDTGNLWTDRKLLVKAQIDKYQFDILGLQETLPAMAGYLVGALPRFDSLGMFSQVNIGILYNTERVLLQSSGQFWLSPTPDVESIGWDAKFKRACIWARFKDRKTSQEFYVFNTHFDHVGAVARTNSAALVLQRIASIAGNTPAMFMGDLNATQYDSIYTSLNNAGLLKDCYNLAYRNLERERGTTSDFDMYLRNKKRIDHIFLTNTLQASEYNVLTDTYNGKTASDHYAVLAKIGWKYNEQGDLYRQFPEDFEQANPYKETYTAAEVTFRTGPWLLNNVRMGGSSANDQPTSGLYGARMINNNTASCYLQMNFDVTEGASKVTVQHNVYNGDTICKWQLEYSKDQGVSWLPAGPVMATNQTTKQQAVFIMDIAGSVRFRVNKLGIGSSNNGRLCVDDFTIYKRKNVTGEKENKVLLGWQLGTPLSTGRQDSAVASFTDAGMEASVLKRGVGWRTITSTGAAISLPGSFAAAATVATGDYATDTAMAIANNLYLQFQVKPRAGNGISLSTLNVRFAASKAGTKTGYWKYSLDGTTYKALAKSFEINNTGGSSISSINLSSCADLQHMPAGKAVYFRLYINGVDATDELVGIGVSNGTASDGYVLSVSGEMELSPATKMVAWQFATPAATGGEATVPASVVDTAVVASVLERGAGLKPVSNATGDTLILSRAFVSSTGVASTTEVTDTAVAIKNNMYFGYSFTVKAGYKVSLYNLNYRIRISAGGAKVWHWKYSLDSVNFTNLAMPVILTAATDSEGDIQPVIDLSGMSALQNIPANTTVYFRLYTNGSNTTTGTTAIGRSAAVTSDDYALSVVGSAEVVAPGEKIIAWQLASPSTTGEEASVNATTIHSAVTATPLVRGAGFNATTLSRAFAALAATVSSADVADTAIAVAGNLYFSTSFTPKAGKTVSLSGLDYKIRISAHGAKVWYWKYSLDGVHFSKLANPFTIGAATSTEGKFMPHMDVSAIPGLQHIPAGTTVTFRLYANGTDNATGSTSIGRSTTASEDVLWFSGSVASTTVSASTARTAQVVSEEQQPASVMHVSVAPNQVYVAIETEKASQSQLVLYDMLGRRLLAKQLSVVAGKNNFSIPVSVKPGVYIVTVYSASGQKRSKKVFCGY